MGSKWRIHFEELAETMRGRRQRMRARIVGFATLGVLYLPILPWPVILLWLAAGGLAMGMEFWSLSPQRIRKGVTAWSNAWSLASILAHGSALAAIAIEIVLRVEPLGSSIAICHALGGLLTAAMGSGRSRIALVAGLAPHVLLLIVIALVLELGSLGAPVAQAVALAGAGMLVAAYAAMYARQSSQLARSEARAREAAQSASAAKSSFIAAVSHELRTPISGIQAGAAELDRTLADPLLRKRASLIVDAAGMMRTLLNDLLDLSKVEAGRMQVERMAFDVRQLVADTMRFWQSEARKTDVRLQLHGGNSLPQWIEGDPTRLRQILNNLLSNAIKFANGGAVALELVNHGDCLTFAVVDHGAGISGDHLAHLFTPFAQAHGGIARTHGGTGLGLALSRDLAQLMGGDLTVESVVGEGSRFALSLPLTLSAAPAEAAAAPTDEPAPLAPLKLLVVDDHEINRRAMALLLDVFGVRPSFAVDGQDALDVLARQPFDLVLMDVHMPKLDGLEVARRVRAGAGPNRQTPIVAVTGATEPADRARCLDAGMTDCVGKPIDPKELFGVLQRALRAPVDGDLASMETQRASPGVSHG